MPPPEHLRHVGVFRVTPNAFAQIALMRTPPVLVLTRRDIVNALDRCRGIAVLVVTTVDSAWHSVQHTRDLVPRLRAALGLSATVLVPDVQRLLDALSSDTVASLELPATRTDGAPAIALPSSASAVRAWPLPHPAAVDWRVYWPGRCVPTLAEQLMATDAFRQVYDACRRPSAVRASSVPALAATLTSVHALFSGAPALPLLLAALCSVRVRARWLTHRTVVGPPALWSYVLHRLLLRAVAVYWQTDAQAAQGLVGLHGVAALPLPAPRLACISPVPPGAPEPPAISVRFEDTLDGSMSALPAAPSSEEPDLMGVSSAVLPLRIDAARPWHRLGTARLAAAAAVHHTGLPAQVVHDITSGEWWLVAESRLAHFIHEFADHALAVPVERRRVCRALGFYSEGTPVPPGSAVIGSMCGEMLAACDKRFSAGLVYNVVDTAPGTLVDSPARLDVDRSPRGLWPLVDPALLLHPLRSSHGAWCLRAGAHWWRCDQPGPSVCLDPVPRTDDLATLLCFQQAHSQQPSTPAPTSVFTCTPPCMASCPVDLPEWARCRLGCAGCSVGEPVAYNGDAALVCRQELACVLWWHWVVAAERLLCDSPRAGEFARHWFHVECTELHDALARCTPLPLVVAPQPAPTAPAPSRSGSFRSREVTLRDGDTWSVPESVAELGERCERPMEPLDALIVYLLWMISGDSCRAEKQWSNVGIALRQLDPDGTHTLARHAFQWWSRKYGGDKYHEDKDFGAANPWWERRSVYNDYGPVRALSNLVHYVKADRRLDTMVYDRALIEQALREFWQDGTAWWGTGN